MKRDLLAIAVFGMLFILPAGFSVQGWAQDLVDNPLFQESVGIVNFHGRLGISTGSYDDTAGSVAGWSRDEEVVEAERKPDELVSEGTTLAIAKPVEGLVKASNSGVVVAVTQGVKSSLAALFMAMAHTQPAIAAGVGMGMQQAAAALDASYQAAQATRESINADPDMATVVKAALAKCLSETEDYTKCVGDIGHGTSVQEQIRLTNAPRTEGVGTSYVLSNAIWNPLIDNSSTPEAYQRQKEVFEDLVGKISYEIVMKHNPPRATTQITRQPGEDLSQLHTKLKQDVYEVLMIATMLTCVANHGSRGDTGWDALPIVLRDPEFDLIWTDVLERNMRENTASRIHMFNSDTSNETNYVPHLHRQDESNIWSDQRSTGIRTFLSARGANFNVAVLYAMLDSYKDRFQGLGEIDCQQLNPMETRPGWPDFRFSELGGHSDYDFIQFAERFAHLLADLKLWRVFEDLEAAIVRLPAVVKDYRDQALELIAERVGPRDERNILYAETTMRIEANRERFFARRGINSGRAGNYLAGHLQREGRSSMSHSSRGGGS